MIVFFLVRGYLPAAPETKKNMMDLNVEQETLRELASRRQNLLLELKNYEANQRAGMSVGSYGMVAGTTGVPGEEEVGMIPAQTQLQTALAINLGTEGKTVSNTLVILLLNVVLYLSLVVDRNVQVLYGFGEEKLMKLIDEVKVPVATQVQTE